MTGPASRGLHIAGDPGYQGAKGARDAIEVRRIPPGSPDHRRVLHRALDLPEPTRRGPTPRPVRELVANVERGTASIDLLFGAYRGDELVGACLAAESPGAAAMVFVPSRLEAHLAYGGTVAALRAVQPAAWGRSIALLEALVPPGRAAVGRALAEAGFRRLTCLRYLKREGGRVAPSRCVATDLEWVPFAPQREALFRETIERTYVQSLDCPELSGVRTTADVLAGHRATGVFDPALWWVARRRGEPVGLILLNRISSEPALELVYMGVAQPARGTGVADALLERALEAAAEAGVNILALAVDERNTRARKVYARWGFAETGARDAWIASPAGA